MWGIIPAAGRGSRIQPLAFSKELLPVGSRRRRGVEQPCAVSEYLVERMIAAGADKLCFVIGPGKSDILAYYGSGFEQAAISYVVQPSAGGLCDALFRAKPFIAADEDVLIGLPDTIWFPLDGFRKLPQGTFSLLLFPVEQPEFFDSVVLDEHDAVLRIDVKTEHPESRWIWGAMRMPGRVFHDLAALWSTRSPRDEYLGTLINAWLSAGHCAHGLRAGNAYVDVGTLNGYRAALHLLEMAPPEPDAAAAGGQSHDRTRPSDEVTP